MRHRTVCFRSSPRYLPAAFPMPFPRSFTTTPFQRSSTGRFEACSCKPAPGDRLPSSIQHQKFSLLFVTHCSLIRGNAHNQFMASTTLPIPQFPQSPCHRHRFTPTPPPLSPPAFENNDVTSIMTRNTCENKQLTSPGLSFVKAHDSDI